MSSALLQLAGLFAMLSMLAFGGGAGVIPDMQRAAVEHVPLVDRNGIS